MMLAMIFVSVCLFVLHCRSYNYVPSDNIYDWQFELSANGLNEFHVGNDDDVDDSAQSRNNNPTKGFVYSAVGERSLREAAVSALSLRSIDGVNSADVNITIVTDTNGIEWFARRPAVKRLFDFVLPSAITDKTWGFRSTKINSYLLTPYDFSMFLDSDTVFCNHALSGGGLEQFMPRQLSTVWTILNRFEFCGVHGGFIGDVNVGRSVLPGVNTGVVVFRKCDAVKRLVIQWRKALHRRREKLEVFQVNDQGALMKAIDHEKDLKFYILPPEWNCRSRLTCDMQMREFTKPWTKCIVSHFHGHATNPSFENWLNGSDSSMILPPMVYTTNVKINDEQRL